MRTSLSRRRYLKWIFPSQHKTLIWKRPASSPISRIAVCLAVSPGSIWPLGIVQRFFESWMSKISISCLSFERRKTIPPAVGSRTISWMAGFFLKTVSRNLVIGEGLYCFGRASGTFRLLPLRARGGFFLGRLFGVLFVIII